MNAKTRTEEDDHQPDPTETETDAATDAEEADPGTFTDLGVSAPFVDALAAQKITAPFPIQLLTVPLGLKGADVIGQARTGTGKTLAFGLPVLESVDPEDGDVQALIVTPTRELCIQVAADLTETGSQAGVRVLAIYGGVPLDPQRDALRAEEVDVVVGTPGRLLDHVRRGNLRLGRVRVLVLDEADRMLDMGFIPDIERIVSECPEDRQTLLFSATMPSEIVGLARRYMDSPTFINAETERQTTAPPETDQHFLIVHRMDKPRVLARILQSPDAELAAVFVRTKRMADRLVDELRELGLNASPIHGDLRQSSREKNLEKFRSGRSEVLVATEVAARGLDIDGVTHVINYDIPDDEKMYLHRIGRTGRAGAAGVAVTFAQHDEVERMNAIRKRVGAADIEVHEVFSTSDLVTELFDLPEKTPWDRFGSDTDDDRPSPSARSGDGRGSRRSSKDSGSRQGSKDRGSREGSKDRGSRQGSKDRGRDQQRSRDREPDGGGDDSSSKPDRSRDRSDAEDRGRSRDRRRSEERGSKSTETSGGTPLPVNDDEEPVRTRTRQREQPQRSEKRSRSRDQRGRSQPEESSRSKGGDRGGSRGGRDRSGRSGSERGRSGSKQGGRDRSDRDRSKGGGGRRDDDQAERTTPTVSTDAGSDARGQGQPTLSRRVKVENVP